MNDANEHDHDVDITDELVRKIRVKEIQLEIAQRSNMTHTSQILKHQLSELRRQLSISDDPEIDALLSFLAEER